MDTISVMFLPDEKLKIDEWEFFHNGWEDTNNLLAIDGTTRTNLFQRKGRDHLIGIFSRDLAWELTL
eukprot:13242965-Ditylum_brightwellii.AAC.1